MAHIMIIVGSTRPNRFGVQPAEFVHKLAQKQTDHTFEMVDLKDTKLPFLEEPTPTVFVKNAEYANKTVRDWAKQVDAADGFIFVTPEYNHGVPAELKNAVDSLHAEWTNKPVAFVSYGTEFGGTRAVEHFRSSLAWFNMFDIKDQFSIHNLWQYLDENGVYQPTDKHVEDATRLIEKIGFWSEEFAAIRKKLAHLS
jgi:NAD(P)H-dependent FMN reductase